MIGISEHRDDRRVGEAEDQHSDKTEQAEDHGLEELAAHERRKRAVRQPRQPDDLIADPLGQKAAADRIRKAADLFLAKQHIDGDDDAEDQIRNRAEQRRRHVHGDGRNGRALLADPVEDLVGNLVDGGLQVLDGRRLDADLRQKVAQKLTQLVGRLRQYRNEHPDDLAQPRNDDDHHQHDQAQRRKQRQQQRSRPQQPPFRLALAMGKQPLQQAFDRGHQHVEHERHAKPQHDRRNDRPKFAESIGQRAEVLQHTV